MYFMVLAFSLLLLGCIWWWRFGERAYAYPTARRSKRPSIPSVAKTTTTTTTANNLKRLIDATTIASKTTRMTSRVDCSKTRRYCAVDDDCASMCLNFRRVRFVCDEQLHHQCVPKFIDERDNGDDGGGGDGDRPCDTANGEFALLVGYTELGAAKWQCVPMYRHFAERAKFCEGGLFEMDANLREPSYRDCQCPTDTKRAIYQMATLYDTGLPHCIPESKWPLFSESMREV